MSRFAEFVLECAVLIALAAYFLTVYITGC